MWDEGAAVQATFRGHLARPRRSPCWGRCTGRRRATTCWGSPPRPADPLVLLGQSGSSDAPSPTGWSSTTPTGSGPRRSAGPSADGAHHHRHRVADLVLPVRLVRGHPCRRRHGRSPTTLPSAPTAGWRPDGASIWIDANATAHQPGRRAAGGRRARRGHRRRSSSEREGQVATTVAAQLPSLAASNLGSNRVELRGDADLRAVCLHASGDTYCSPAAIGQHRVWSRDPSWSTAAGSSWRWPPHPSPSAPDSPTRRSSSGRGRSSRRFPDPVVTDSDGDQRRGWSGDGPDRPPETYSVGWLAAHSMRLVGGPGVDDVGRWRSRGGRPCRSPGAATRAGPGRGRRCRC